MASLRAASLVSSLAASASKPIDLLSRYWIQFRPLPVSLTFFRVRSSCDPIQRGRAQFGVTILEFREEAIPEVFHQAKQQFEPFAQPGNSLGADPGLGQPGAEPQVLALLGEPLGAQLDDERPVGALALVFPGPGRCVVIFTPRFLDL